MVMLKNALLNLWYKDKSNLYNVGKPIAGAALALGAVVSDALLLLMAQGMIPTVSPVLVYSLIAIFLTSTFLLVVKNIFASFNHASKKNSFNNDKRNSDIGISNTAISENTEQEPRQRSLSLS